MKNLNNTKEKNAVKLVMFSHNRKDTAFVRRVVSLIDSCEKLTTFSFRRDGEPRLPGPDWDNIDLGYAEHAKFHKRVFLYISAIAYVVKHRQVIRDADVIHARNLDVFLFAWFATSVACFPFGSRKRLVYECLDVHEALTKDGLVARVLRWLERRVLSRSDLLIVSSPGFINNYFTPMQKYTGKSYIAENKLYFAGHVVPRPEVSIPDMSLIANEGQQAVEKKFVIAWVGIIRCAKTLELLRALAIAESGRVTIRISGLVSYFLIPDFDEQIADIPNIIFEGSYDWPTGLAQAYRSADLVWSQELSWSGYNSDWLIPNRVYEGSYFGVLSLAVAGTQTGLFVEERQIGYVIKDAEPATLIEFVQSLDFVELKRKKERLLRADQSLFVTSQADADNYLFATNGSS